MEATPHCGAGRVRDIQDIRITPDGQSVAFEVYRTISDLYLATGLK